jgi:hypothetical protein
LSDFEACLGETPRPESPASRAGVSALEVATAALHGSTGQQGRSLRPRASGPSRSSGRQRRRIAMCSGKLIGYLDFSRRGVFIGEGASSGVGRGALTHRRRGQGLDHAALVCGALVAPLCLLFGSLEASVDFWMFGFCFVQFQEYFLCNFSETQKQQKTGNWHYGDLLIG